MKCNFLFSHPALCTSPGRVGLPWARVHARNGARTSFTRFRCHLHTFAVTGGFRGRPPYVHRALRTPWSWRL